MIRPTRGAAIYCFRDFLTRSVATEEAVFRTSGSVSSSAAIPSSIVIVSRAGVPFLKQTIASRRTATFGSRAASSWRSGRYELTSPGCDAREALERDQRRPAHGRALVLEAASEQLELLAEAELCDRAVRERADAVVGVAGGVLDLVAPLAAEVCELALEALRRVLVRERGGLREVHQPRRERSRAGADVDGGRADEPVEALLLEDVGRPAGRARAGEHRRREHRRDVGDVEDDRRPELDVRHQWAVGLARLQLGDGGPLELLGDLEARRAEVHRSPPQQPRARVLGAVDAVAEAHQALAAVEQILDETARSSRPRQPHRASAARGRERRRGAGPRARRRPTRGRRRSRPRSRRRRGP